MISKRKTSFVCENCQQIVSEIKLSGTRHRNHCPFCLWSKHIDWQKRNFDCSGLMKPLGLTFMNKKPDKYGHQKIGELMIIHQCQKCSFISINRLAGDDDVKSIESIYKQSQSLDQSIIDLLIFQQINLLNENDYSELKKQLYGIVSPV